MQISVSLSLSLILSLVLLIFPCFFLVLVIVRHAQLHELVNINVAITVSVQLLKHIVAALSGVRQQLLDLCVGPQLGSQLLTRECAIPVGIDASEQLSQARLHVCRRGAPSRRLVSTSAGTHLLLPRPEVLAVEIPPVHRLDARGRDGVTVVRERRRCERHVAQPANARRAEDAVRTIAAEVR